MLNHRSATLDAGIRQAIVSVLHDEDITVSTATAIVAEGWGARREKRGDSPASVLVISSMVFQVGAELAQEIAAA